MTTNLIAPNIDGNTKVTVHSATGPVVVDMNTLIKMGGAITAPAEKPKRRIVSGNGAKAPAAATDLSAALKGLKTDAKAVPTVVDAPKSRKTHEGVTITITKELVVVEEGKAAVEMLVLSKRWAHDGKGKNAPKKGTICSHFNYAFDKGYCYYATKGATPPRPSWKWNNERDVRFIPVNDIEVLLQGLREYYAGATVSIDGQSFSL